MKFILLGLASTLAVAGPVAAQSSGSGSQYRDNQYRGSNQNQTSDTGDISSRIDQLETRIQTGVQSGAISRSEAVPLRQQYSQLTALENRYSSNGFTSQERTDLQDDIRDLRQQIRLAEGGAQGGDDRYGDRGQDRQYDRRGTSDDSRASTEPAPRQSIGSMVDGLVGQRKPN